MEVLRGRSADVAADVAATRRLVNRVRETGRPAVRVWCPPAHVAFGRRDAGDPGYRCARRAAAARGFPPVERTTGGRAVAHTGSTLAFVRADPIDHERTGVAERYERTTVAVQDALAALGVAARRGEPAATFCPGTHSLQAAGKLVGLAQRIGDGVGTVAGIAIVADRASVVDVLGPVYGALGLALDPGAVGSLARAGGPADVDRVSREVESALVGETATTVSHVGATGPPVRET